MKIELPEKIYNEIKEYCRTNNIDDIDKFIRRILNQGFTTEKLGVIGENKTQKKELIEKLIISAITIEPEIKIIEKIVYSAETKEPEIKIIYSGENKNTINYVYNINAKESKVTKPKDTKENIDLYGEKNIRKI